MAKKDYSDLSKEELIELVDKLESKKKYGLVWDEERVPEKVVMDCQQKLPVLTEVSGKSITTNENEPTHILIEGDNFHSLSVLSYTHKDKIDIIYIDPPYNTGNKTEWKYNDQYVDGNDNYRHSKWLNMMGKRLELAKDLIKPGGSIFLSIGDDEVANLKLLCDKILGVNNFITVMSRIAKTASNLGKFFAPSCDYVLLYTKQAEDLNDDSFNQDVNADLYKKEDENGFYRDDIAFYQSSQKDLRPNQRYFVQCPDGSFVIPPGTTLPKYKNDGELVTQKEGDKRWRWAVATYLQKQHLLVFKETKTSPLLDENGKQAKYNIYTKSYLNEREV
jgi:adenine-specific DNA-methyltransferase